MPLFEEPTNQKTTDSHGNQTNQTNPQTLPKSNILITTLGSLLPLVPFAWEQFTGQKVPQMSGTIAEIQTALVQIQSGMQTMVQNQNQIWKELENLKTTATQQFTNLAHQFQSLRLTHTKERKEIEYNPNKPITNQEY